MIANDVRIRVEDWKDPEFLLVLQEALTESYPPGRDGCQGEMAHCVQDALRSHGYPRASVEYLGTAHDVLSGIARWVVRRGSPRDSVH
jgi:hypothetical protein